MLPKFKIFFVIFFLLFFIFALDASAQVVINEFSSATSNDDWVEIYYSDRDITLYQLVDAKGNVKNFSDDNCTGNFCTVSWFNRLDNSGDIIKLVLISAPDSSVDQVTYGDVGGICAPVDGQTIGRYPNETGGFVRFASHTKGTTNTSSQDPCPTPTPEPPTPTPKSSEPTASPSPSESPSPTPKATVKAAATKKPTSKPKVIEEESDENGEDFILGLREELETDAPSSESEGKKKFPIFAGLFIVGGLGAIGFAGYSFIKNKRKKYNGVDDNNQQGNRPESL